MICNNNNDCNASMLHLSLSTITTSQQSKRHGNIDDSPECAAKEAHPAITKPSICFRSRIRNIRADDRM